MKMRKKDRERIVKLYELAGAIPFPASGSRTTSMAGLGEFAQDMRYFQPKYHTILLAILEEDAGLAGDDLTFGRADDLIAELQEWVAKRKECNWSAMSLADHAGR
jgi:hypothetical protein